MEYKDYYQILGISNNASQDDIKRAYRKLARKYHPDLNSEADAEERFKEVGEAYEVLKDPEKRVAYDQLGANWKAGQAGFQPPPDWDAGFEYHGGGFTSAHEQDFSDFFESLFGQQAGGFSGQRTGGHGFQVHGQDSHARIFIDLEDAYHGATRSLTLRATELDGSGRPIQKTRTLNVKIPRGVRPGQNIRLQAQGSAGIGGGKPGDLYLEVEFNPHSIYRVDGHDVYIDVPLTPWEAALGCSIDIPTPDGMVELKVPEASSSGKKMRLRGRGIPGKTAGDFYVVLEIVMPKKLSSEEKNLYQSLRAESGYNPRAELGGWR